MDYVRGDIVYVNCDNDCVGSEQQGSRPAVIVSNNKCNEHSPVIEVVYLTTQKKTWLPTHATVKARTPSTALCEQVVSISKSKIGNYIRTCTDNEMREIDKCLLVSLALDTPQPKCEQEIDDSAAVERDIYKKLYHELLEKVVNK